jgi:hypothetical protein
MADPALALFAFLLWVSPFIEKWWLLYEKIKWPAGLVLVSILLVALAPTAAPEEARAPGCTPAKFHPNATRAEILLAKAIRTSLYRTPWIAHSDLCLVCVWQSQSFLAWVPPFDVTCYRDPVIQFPDGNSACPARAIICHNQTICENFSGLVPCDLVKVVEEWRL